MNFSYGETETFLWVRELAEQNALINGGEGINR